MKTSNSSSALSSASGRKQHGASSRSTATSSMNSYCGSTSSSVCTKHTTKSIVTTRTSTSSSVKSSFSSRRGHIEQVLTKIARNDPNIKKASLNCYSFAREERIIDLCLSLAGNTHLEILYLHECEINDLGISLLAYALRKNTSLRQLWLDRNNIRDVGAKSIASALSRNSTLQILGLNHNHIDICGCHAIERALKKNRVVTEVFLRGNRISQSAAYRVYEYCERNYRDGMGKKSSASTISSLERSKRGFTLQPIQEHLPATSRTTIKRNSIAAKCA